MSDARVRHGSSRSSHICWTAIRPAYEDAAVTAPRVLILLDTSAAWSRGILLGFAEAAHARGWTLMHYPPQVDLRWLLEQLAPNAIVCGPALAGPWPAALRERVSV